MTSKRRAGLILITVIALLVLASASLAQSAGQAETPVQPPAALPPLDLNDLARQALIFALGLVAAFAASPATTAAVAFLKRFPPFADIRAETLAVIVAVVLMVALAVAITLGVETQFRSVLNVITAILTVLGGTTFNLIGASMTYNAALARGTPLVGQARKVEPGGAAG